MATTGQSLLAWTVIWHVAWSLTGKSFYRNKTGWGPDFRDGFPYAEGPKTAHGPRERVPPDDP